MSKKDLFESPDYYLLDELLSDEHKLIRASVRDWVKKEVSPIIEDYAQRAEFPKQLLKGLAEMATDGTPIWVLQITHKHGDDFWTFGDEQAALDRLAIWARQWWHDEGLDGDPTQLRDDEVISDYFGRMEERGREFYDIVQTSLNQG